MSGNQVLNLLLDFFKIYGYWVVFFGTLLESTIVVGLFVPGDFLLLAAGFFSYQGNFSPIYVILTGTFGGVLGNTLGYLAGFSGGRPLLRKFRRFDFISRRVDSAERYFDAHGNKTVFVGRFAAGVKAFIAVLAGVSQMNFSSFFIYTVLATFIWTTAVTLVGLFFGQNWDLAVGVINKLGWSGLILIILLLMILYLLRRRRLREKENQNVD